jgi:hypothetical protein
MLQYRDCHYFLLPLLALTACAFDETEMPPLPEEVIYPQGRGDDDDSSIEQNQPATSCPRAEPDLEDFGVKGGPLSGKWARKTVLAQETDPRENGDFQDSTMTYLELVEIEQNDAKMRETVELCDLDMMAVAGAKTGFPPLFIASMPVLAEEGEFLTSKEEGEIIGAAYANEKPLTRLWGLSPAAAEKEWEHCDSYFNPENLAEECPIALWPEVIDMDCDENPGITVQITLGAIGTEELYSLRRTKVWRKGTVETIDKIAGAVTYTEDTAIIGTSKEMFKSNAPMREVNEKSSFEMIRLDDSADCNDVLKKYPFESSP